MKNIKQKIIAIILLIVVVGGLIWLTSLIKSNNKTDSTDNTGITLFTKKNPGTKDVKNQGNIGNQNNEFTGNDTTKPVSIVENIINTITGKNDNTTTGDKNVPIGNNGIGQAIKNFFLGSDGLPSGGSEITNEQEVFGVNTNKNSDQIPGIDVPVEITDTTGSEINNPECTPSVYISRYTQWQDLQLQIKIGQKKESTLNDDEKTLYRWKPTKKEIDEDNMKRVLHRYWDIWSYPDNYIKSSNSQCGTWSDTTGVTEDDFLNKANPVINTNTINAAKRKARQSFSAISTIISSTFSVNQSEGQKIIAINDNERYNDLLNDCRVIRSQFEGGYTYALDGKTRVSIPQYYFPNQLGTATGRDNTAIAGQPLVWTHEKIAEDLSRRAKLNSKDGSLGDVIRSEVVKNELINWKDASNILTKTEIGNISYLTDKDRPTYDLEYNFPKNKAENMNIFNSNEDARFYLTKYPKLQYGGPNGDGQLRGSTFWSGSQNAQNFNPGMYMISEPQNIWDLLNQDKNKVLFCRLNKFMGQWAGIETNVRAVGYVNSHGINCDNEVRGDTLNIPGIDKNTPDNIVRNVAIGGTLARLAPQALLLGFTETINPFARGGGINDSIRLSLDDVKKIGPLPSFYNMFDSATIMREFIGVDRDNWYSNNVQNMVFEFIKDED